MGRSKIAILFSIANPSRFGEETLQIIQNNLRVLPKSFIVNLEQYWKEVVPVRYFLNEFLIILKDKKI